MLLGAIADDFTGASDLANTLAKGGMATTQFVGVPEGSASADCEAGVVALKTRSIAPEDAVRQSLEAADWLKDLTERVGATFVYAGIDVTTSTVFSGVRGAQLAGRASLIDCGALPARAGGREPFRELIAALEAALDLRSHRTGRLPRLAPYLHERTAGRIGSLARLIRQAAIEAILDGHERITKALLDSIALDHIAEEHYRPRTPPSRRPSSR